MAQSPARKTKLPWKTSGWTEQAEAWMHAQLTQPGRQPIGSVEWVHQRPWSAFARLQTQRGWVYFKAPAPAYLYEAPLTAALAHWMPKSSVPLLAHNLEQG